MLEGVVCENLTRDFIKRQKQTRMHSAYALVLDFLRTEGLAETAESFKKEVPSVLFHQLCDNMSLDIVLQDYEAYYQLRYQKQPRIHKKTEETPSKTRRKPSASLPKLNSNKKPDVQTSPTIPSITVLGYEQGEPTPDSKVKPDCFHHAPFVLPPSLSEEGREMMSAIELVESGNVTFDQILGLDEPKKIIRESLLLPRQFPSLFGGLLRPWSSLLLFGPPGNGKTMLARAIASECHMPLLQMPAAALISKWRGDSEKALRLLFETALLNRPCVLFIDEIDSLIAHRVTNREHEASRRLKAELLQRLDRLEEDPEGGVFLVAATNLPWDLDAALVRRLQRRVLVDLPGPSEREALMKLYSGWKKEDATASGDDADWRELVDSCSGYSAADLRLVCRHALLNVARQCMEQPRGEEQQELPQPTHQQLVEAVSSCKPGGSCQGGNYREWAASHAAG